MGGLWMAEVQKLRMEQRLPQFCSHCAWTLCVTASFTSSPQVSRRFTRSTYGLEVESREKGNGTSPERVTEGSEDTRQATHARGPAAL